MSAHTLDREPKQRIPLELFGADILLLLRLRHKLEIESGKNVKTNEIIRLALRAYAQQHEIVE